MRLRINVINHHAKGKSSGSIALVSRAHDRDGNCTKHIYLSCWKKTSKGKNGIRYDFEVVRKFIQVKMCPAGRDRGGQVRHGGVHETETLG